MKTLSVRQPYATLICAGVKPIENRSWNTDYRGTILIHASKNYADLFKMPELQLFHEYDKMISSSGEIKKSEGKILKIENDRIFLIDENYRKEYELLKTEIAEQADKGLTVFCPQAIIGSVEIVDVVKNSDSKFAEPGNFHWILKNPVLFQNPIEDVKGKLRFWDFNGDIDETPKTMVKE
jgi:hypothetical protein